MEMEDGAKAVTYVASGILDGLMLHKHDGTGKIRDHYA
jgi:hypothetical protein